MTDDPNGSNDLSQTTLKQARLISDQFVAESAQLVRGFVRKTAAGSGFLRRSALYALQKDFAREGITIPSEEGEDFPETVAGLFDWSREQYARLIKDYSGNDILHMLSGSGRGFEHCLYVDSGQIELKKE